jgi:tetratricopeptide (TPR) repeat protein
MDNAFNDYSEALRLVHAKELHGISNIGHAFRKLSKVKGTWEFFLNGCSDAIRRYPDVPSLYDARGQTYFEKGDFDKAIVDFKDAIRLEPKNGRYHSQLARAYEKARDWDNALAEATQAVEIANVHYAYRKSDDYRLRAEIYRFKGDVAKADADLDKAIQILSEEIQKDPKNIPAIYALRSHLFCAQGKYDEALADCNRAIELEPASDRPLCERGLLYLEKGENDKALTDFDKAAGAPARNAETQARLRIARAMAIVLTTDNWDKARAEYKMALRYDGAAEPSFQAWEDWAMPKVQTMYAKLADNLKKP